jgi:hypothetical protein
VRRVRCCPADDGWREPKPPNAPSRRIWSYFAFFSLSERTPCASEIALNFSAAAALFGLASGWYCLASFRYAFLISSGEAESGTPSSA